MLPKIIRTGIHRYEGTGVRKTEMATQYRKAYVPVTLDVDKEGAILPRLIWWDNGVIFQIDQILYKGRATSKKVGGRRHPLHSSDSVSYTHLLLEICHTATEARRSEKENLFASQL